MGSQRELFEYYNARAPEYEEFYDGGTSAKNIAPALIRKEVSILKKTLPDYINGRCIDVACGTGFWLPVYEKNCDGITLIDQSENVLSECAEKIEKLGIEHKAETLCEDIFSCSFAERLYNSAVIAFLISHLTDNEVNALIEILKLALVPVGKFVIMDNVWNEMVAAIPARKFGVRTRTLKNRRQFKILKRYFEKQDLYNLAKKNNINLEIIYWGNVFFLATGRFTST